VVTFDHEHVPAPVLEALEETGVAVRPGPGALFHAQDKAHMRRTLTDLGQPCPAWCLAKGPADVVQFAAGHGWPVVLKVSRGGYDGRGVWVVRTPDEVHEVMASAVPTGVQWLVEQRIPFVRELSAQVARSPHGQAVAYPVVQTTQVDGICSEVIAPAPGLDPARAVQAQRIALQIAGDLGVVGMLAVEMFDTGDELLVNELAMRPHNSGHWTIEGAVTSQFENHLRAVLGLPLGDTSAVGASVMLNWVGTMPDAGPVLSSAAGHWHDYGKSAREGRKVGHATLRAGDRPALAAALGPVVASLGRREEFAPVLARLAEAG